MSIPIIDLFAGPGGLGEGFSSYRSASGQATFHLALSIEKDPVAHRTLMLRAVFRHLTNSPSISLYYKYVRGQVSSERFLADDAVAAAYAAAQREALCLELGVVDPALVDKEIKHQLKGVKDWVLIGGPPCQAYSLAGRSRRIRDETFDADNKHVLYREYLRIVHRHRPAIFVMENVKGLLSSRHEGDSIFEKIIQDLSFGDAGLAYEIHSFVHDGRQSELVPADYVIRAERFGVPQTRHRVILLGIRKNSGFTAHGLLEETSKVSSVGDVISDLPKLRSRVSRSLDTQEKWLRAIKDYYAQVKTDHSVPRIVVTKMKQALQEAKDLNCVGGSYLKSTKTHACSTGDLRKWLVDPKLRGVTQHEARSHMASDLGRYLYASCHAASHHKSPSLEQFPSYLLPNHRNAKQAEGVKAPFADRFRVQCEHLPATTVVSHIAKDGHYYIHYDPAQCRSLTVREAARLQTFPDNYFFEGNRTEQYTQVGNAVPPYLAIQLAAIVANLLDRPDD